LARLSTQSDIERWLRS